MCIYTTQTWANKSDAENTLIVIADLRDNYFLIIFILECRLDTIRTELEIQNVFDSLHAQRYSTLHIDVCISNMPYK